MDIETQTHLKTLRQLLQYRESELQADVQSARQLRDAGNGAAAGEVADQKDQAAQVQREEVDDAGLARDLAELAQVEQALRRLDEGRYGDCVGCGEPIPLQRLMAQPAASRCAACQALAERRH